MSRYTSVTAHTHADLKDIVQGQNGRRRKMGRGNSDRRTTQNIGWMARGEHLLITAHTSYFYYPSTGQSEDGRGVVVW